MTEGAGSVAATAYKTNVNSIIQMGATRRCRAKSGGEKLPGSMQRREIQIQALLWRLEYHSAGRCDKTRARVYLPPALISRRERERLLRKARARSQRHCVEARAKSKKPLGRRGIASSRSLSLFLSPSYSLFEIVWASVLPATAADSKVPEGRHDDPRIAWRMIRARSRREREREHAEIVCVYTRQ